MPNEQGKTWEEKQQAYNKQYSERNKKQIKARKKIYYQTNKEKIKAYNKQLYQDNKERKRQQNQEQEINLPSTSYETPSQFQESQRNISVIKPNPQYQQPEPLDWTIPSTSSGIQYLEQRPFVNSETSEFKKVETSQLQATNDCAPSNVQNSQHYKKLWIRQTANVTGSSSQQQQIELDREEVEQVEAEFSFN